MVSGVNVLSLFDGISCGRLAFERAGIPINQYVACEIDKYAIKIASKNYPNTIQRGDVTKYYPDRWFDYVIGGSPCQDVSFAGKGEGLAGSRSKLFWEYARILGQCKVINPNVKFLLENVKMKKESSDIISCILGVEPVCINSALLSAQNRVRYYWCNWKVEQPKDKGIFLKDIIEDDVVDRDKSYCIDANYNKGGNLQSNHEDCRRQLVFIAREQGRRFNENGIRDDKNGKMVRMYEPNYSGKSYCLSTVQKDNFLAIRDKSKTVRSSAGGSYDRHEWDSVDDYHIRKLTVVECERLQTLPDRWTEGVSNSQRYKALGNGWTVDVIEHILRASV